MRLSGRIQQCGDRFAVEFPHPAAKSEELVFDSVREAEAVLDFLNLKAALEADAILSSLPLSRPLEAYTNMLDDLQNAEWESLCLALSQGGRGDAAAEGDDVEDINIAAASADATAEGPASAVQTAAFEGPASAVQTADADGSASAVQTAAADGPASAVQTATPGGLPQPPDLPVVEELQQAERAQVQQGERPPASASEQQGAALQPAAQQQPAQQCQGSAGVGPGRGRAASRLRKAAQEPGQTKLDAFVRRLPSTAAAAAEAAPEAQGNELGPPAREAESPVQPAQTEQLSGAAVAATTAAAGADAGGPAQQAALLTAPSGGPEQQRGHPSQQAQQHDRQQREQQGHQAATPQRTASGSGGGSGGSSGGGAPTCKRQRRSEAERLLPFFWDPQLAEHPYNEGQIKPTSSRRIPKRKRGLLDSDGPTPTASRSVPAQHADPSAADTAGTPDQPQAAATAGAAAARPAASNEGPTSVDAASGRVQGLAASGQLHRPPAVEEPTGREACCEAFVPATGLPTAAVQAATSQQAEEEGQQSRDQQAEQAPVLPPAQAGLAFGAAWLVLRGGVEARAAQARADELASLLAPVAQASSGAARAVQLFTCCFCSVLAPHQQAQHLQQLRAELAAGGVAAVQEWVELTLAVLQLPTA